MLALALAVHMVRTVAGASGRCDGHCVAFGGGGVLFYVVGHDFFAPFVCRYVIILH